MKYYHFVYELCYNNKPFYVGYTRFILFRYQMHIYDCLSRPYSFVRYMICTFGMYPDINIIYCTENKMECLDIEEQQIKLRINEGYKLLNNEWVKFPHVKLNNRKLSREVSLRIKEQHSKFIKEYEQQNNN